jgi:ABC-type multidrug transport system fused ATPase/permease subunit
MDLPYEWHINKNSSRVVQNIVTETIQFCNIVMVPFLRLFGNIIILFFLFLLILRENVLFTLLLMLTIFLVFFIFHKFSQKTTPRLGKIISKSNEMIIKNIQQGLGSVKEAKITGKQDFFVKNMERLSVDYAESSTKQRTINISPVSIIEFSVVAYILAWIGAYTYLGKDLELLLPLLTVVALTGLRILPFMGMVMQTINNFHNADYFVNKLYQDLKYLEEVGRDVVRGEVKDFKKIEIKSLFFGYGGGDVLRDINISFKNKQVIGITGKTGSGKTTLINILLGLLENERGQFFVDNKEISNKSLRYLMAYIPQDIFLLDDSIRNNIAFGIEESKINEKKVIESLKSAQVYDLIESLPDGLDTIVGENGVRLSGGQRQRLGIARALYYDRKIFVFDEATSSLDYKTEKKVQEAISSLKDKKTVIMIAHRLKTLKDCDMIHVIEDGNIVKSGKHASIMKHLAN